MRPWLLLVPVIAVGGAFAWGSGKGRTLLGARQLASEASQYIQNPIHPGCGVGRENAWDSFKKLVGSLRNNPGFVAPLLADADKEVRAATALAVQHQNYPASIKGLASAYAQEKDVRVRECIVYSLAMVGGEHTIPTLRIALEDSEFDIRHIAMAGLQYGDVKVEKGIRQKLDAEAEESPRKGYRRWLPRLVHDAGYEI